MKDNIVSVRLWGKEICRLQWEGGYRKAFGKVGARVTFSPDYGNTGFDVDPIGQYRKSVYLVQNGLSDICRAKEYEGLPRFLSGSLPDDWGNQVFSAWIESNKLRMSDITPVDKLSFIGCRGMGGLEFFPEYYKQESKNSVELEELFYLARKLESSRGEIVLSMDEKLKIGDLMQVGMSAGGKHPKAIIAINWETGQIKSGQLALPAGFDNYILKFRDSDVWPTAEIEYTYYLMARDCGIDMEESRLIEIGGFNHFLTKRFDRNGNNKMHSATLRALNGETYSYEDAFKVCRKLRLPYHDLEQLYRQCSTI